jgi:hypothetical protein
MKTKPPSRGRPPGSKNKVGRTAKENIVAVFTRLGGTAAMAEWARENLTEFYRLYGRLIPLEGAVTMNMNNSLVQVLSGMPRSNVLEAIEEARPLSLENDATDAEEVAVINTSKKIGTDP